MHLPQIARCVESGMIAGINFPGAIVPASYFLPVYVLWRQLDFPEPFRGRT
jgi:hypothetical protein